MSRQIRVRLYSFKFIFSFGKSLTCRLIFRGEKGLWICPSNVSSGLKRKVSLWRFPTMVSRFIWREAPGHKKVSVKVGKGQVQISVCRMTASCDNTDFVKTKNKIRINPMFLHGKGLLWRKKMVSFRFTTIWNIISLNKCRKNYICHRVFIYFSPLFKWN